MGLMPWHYDLEAWGSRVWLAVAGEGLAGPYITVIPPQLDSFWDSTKGGIQADADDIRVRSWDYSASVAAVDFSNDAPNIGTRTIANFNIELSTDLATDIVPYAIYWGNASAANAEGTVTTTNSTTYRWSPGRPDPARTVLCRSEPVGTANSLLQAFVKKQDEEIDLFWDMTDALGEGPPMAGRATSLFTLRTVDFDATTGTGVYESTGTTRDVSSTQTADTQFLEYDGRFYVGIRLTADAGHASGSDFIVKLRGTFATFPADGGGDTLTYEFRALMQVRDTTS